MTIAMTALLAGFECGRLGWNGHDLLRTTRHMPEDRMPAHYDIACQHGLTRSRDGLPWRHDPKPRLRCAHAAGLSVIWDLNHFDPPDDPVAHARRVAEAANRVAPLWICPVNEPSLYPTLCGMSQQAAVHLAITMARVAMDHHPEVRILSTDPITGIGERQFAATDALVAAGLVDVVGVNYYPHTARTSLFKVLTKVARRYRLPIMVAETSWHDGHPIHHRRHPGWSKGDWLRHILQDVRPPSRMAPISRVFAGTRSSIAHPGTARGHGNVGRMALFARILGWIPALQQRCKSNAPSRCSFGSTMTWQSNGLGGSDGGRGLSCRGAIPARSGRHARVWRSQGSADGEIANHRPRRLPVLKPKLAPLRFHARVIWTVGRSL